MKRRSISAVLALVSMTGVCLTAGPAPAYADGRRDLEDGIAFYENLDTDRAVERLQAASTASDLPAKDRARAFLYLGIVQFEVGKEREAQSAWHQGFALDRSISAPPGTSPKVIQALEKARSSAPKSLPPSEPVPGEPAPGEAKQLPGPAEPNLTDPGPPPAGDDDGPSWLLWTGVGVGAVALAGLTIFLVTRGGSECEGGGGCALVTLR